MNRFVLTLVAVAALALICWATDGGQALQSVPGYPWILDTNR